MRSPSGVMAANGCVGEELVATCGKQHLSAGNQKHPANKRRTAVIGWIGNGMERSTVKLEELGWTGEAATFTRGPGHAQDAAVGHQAARSVLCFHQLSVVIERKIWAGCPSAGLVGDIGWSVDGGVTAGAGGENSAVGK